MGHFPIDQFFSITFQRALSFWRASFFLLTKHAFLWAIFMHDVQLAWVTAPLVESIQVVCVLALVGEHFCFFF